MFKFCAIIIGAPGSGKGTIAKRAIEAFNLIHLSTGDVIRQHIRDKTEIGRKIEQYANSGKLVPDTVVNKLLNEELTKILDKDWLLDGYPRTKEQCNYLSKLIQINLCINLDVPFDVIRDRLQSRWIHPKSGRVYNIGFNDPKTPGIDDVTGEKLIQRDDDKPEFVNRRLQIYSETIKPVTEYYRKLGVLQDFHGETTNEIWPKVHDFMLKMKS